MTKKIGILTSGGDCGGLMLQLDRSFIEQKTNIIWMFLA
jgi:6-phosphofructokinase